MGKIKKGGDPTNYSSPSGVAESKIIPYFPCRWCDCESLVGPYS